jgi:hypothetical protein
MIPNVDEYLVISFNIRSCIVRPIAIGAPTGHVADYQAYNDFYTGDDQLALAPMGLFFDHQ